MALIQSNRFALNQSSADIKTEIERGPSPAVSENTSASNSTSTDQNKKPNRTFSKGKDIRDTPRYHDLESHITQRNHNIGTGVFNADNIDDLPPRYRTKVLNAFEWLAATFPQSNMTASDLITLNPTYLPKQPHLNSSYGSQGPRDSSFSQGSQNSRGRTDNHRGAHNQRNFRSDRSISSNYESASHSLYSNHLSHNSFDGSLPRSESRASSTSLGYTDGPQTDLQRSESRASSTSSRFTDCPQTDFQKSESRLSSTNSRYTDGSRTDLQRSESRASSTSLRYTDDPQADLQRSESRASSTSLRYTDDPQADLQRSESRASSASSRYTDGSRTDLQRSDSRASSTSSRYTGHKKVEPTFNNRSDSQNVSCIDSQSFEVSSREILGNSQKPKPKTKSFHKQNAVANRDSSNCSDLPVKSSDVSDLQPVHTGERIPPPPGFEKSIPNAGSQHFSKTENLPSNQNCAPEERKRNNSYKSVVNERTNKFSDINSTADRKGFVSSTQNRDQKHMPNSKDSNFVDNANRSNQRPVTSQISSVPSGKKFPNKKHNRNSSVGSNQSSSENQDFYDRKASYNLLNTDTTNSHGSNNSSGDKKKFNLHNKNFSDGQKSDASNPSLRNAGKRHNNNRNKPNKFSASEPNCVPSMEFFSSDFKQPSILNCDQSQESYLNSTISIKPPTAPIKESRKEDVFESMLEVIDQRNKESRNRFNNEGERTSSLSSTKCGAGDKYSNQNNPRHNNNSEFSDSRANDIHADRVCDKSYSQNPVSSKSFSNKNKSNSLNEQTSQSLLNINDSRRNSFRKNANRGRPNSRNSVSSDFSDERITNFSHQHKNLPILQENNATSSNSSRDFNRRPDSETNSTSKFSSSRKFDDRTQSQKADCSNSDKYASDESQSASDYLRRRAAETRQENYNEERIERETIPKKNSNKCEEKGFFVSVNVSDSSDKEVDWQKFFSSALKHNKFVFSSCCKFTDSLILSFEDKSLALDASSTLKKLKQKRIVPGQPHLIIVGNVKYRRVRPCDCQDKMVQSCLIYFKEFSEKYIQEHQMKMLDVEEELHALNRKKGERFLSEQKRVLKDTLIMLEDMERVFKNYINTLKLELMNVVPSYFHICKLKNNFMRECQSFQRSLPIYSRKDDILQLLRYHPVTVVSAETGSGKSTQLTEYLLQSWVADRGTIICTQPRKIAAISITNYVCGKIGSAVGKLVGYDVGTERKFDKNTKIIYMTDYALLRKFLRNRSLKGISCVIIDEAHERTLHTDLVLGMLNQCLKRDKDRQDLRVVITSATIDPSVFVQYFSFLKSAVIDVPGRVYPVEVVWMNEDVSIGWNYLKPCVEKAVKIHIDQPNGDILVFLTSPSEIDEAILMFKDMYSNAEMPLLMSLHGKSDLHEQKRIFEVTSGTTRKIIFATNAAETSLTIPGVKYVIDCGMAKEMSFFPAKNKNCLMMNFINKSSAEQRKGRAGRTQPGVCYRMYSKKNFREMPDRSSPEILRTSLQSALLKLYEFGIDPHTFDFIESPSKESIAKSLESLELLDLVKEERLTDLGKQVVELEIEPRLAKLVLQGIKAGVGYEMIIIAAMVREANRIFIRADDIKVLADQKKLTFCQDTGDLCTLLEVYKRYREVAKEERYDWCVQNFINSKALCSAEKTIKDIIVCLHLELSIHVIRRYNNQAFKANFETIVFKCFSENLCMYSGHPKVGYFSFLLNDSLYIHPSSSLYYLGKDLPQFLVYSTLLQTTQNFLMDVTPITEEVLNKSYHKGYFQMSADVLKTLKVLPKVLGPFGDFVLRHDIIGKGGSKIVNLEVMIEKLTNSRNFKIDVVRDNGTIVIYSEGRFHQKISQYISDIVNEAHNTLTKEEDIVKMPEGFFYLCIGLGGIVNDIIMPGEFREIIIENVREHQVKDLETHLQNFGNLKNIQTKKENRRKGYKSYEISATYMKVKEALEAKYKLSQMNLNVKSSTFIQENSGKEKPIYRIQLSWSRSLSDGTGWVEFDSESDCICASGCLSSKSFSIGNNYIRFSPSSLNVRQLEMRNLPSIVEESVIEANLASLLPPMIKIKSINIKRKKLPAVTNDNSLQMQKKLAAEFGRFAAPSKMIIDVNCPPYGDPMWRALVYFDNPDEGERAFKELNGKLCIDSVLVKLNAIRQSHLFCKSQVLSAVQKEVDQVKVQFPDTSFTFNPTQNGSMVEIKFSCKSMEHLFAVQQKLLGILQGVTIEGFGNKKLSHLFSVRGHQLIAKIERITKTVITLDNTRKIISIYGSKENCQRAREEIRLLVEKEVSSKKKVFDLKNSCMPKGFLKCLYIKYGFDLEGLIGDFGLKAAVLDAFKGTLIIEGSSQNLLKVEEHLEEICTELYNKHQTVKLDEGKEICAICLDPLSIDYHRLENCGHAFCKECLLFQVESKTIPLVCTKKDCGKNFFMIDIKTLLSRGDKALRKNFYDSVLQYHVQKNVGKISYCPIPDCNMVYRVSMVEAKHHCPGCQNTICSYCQTPDHYMPCEMYKRCKEDEDYSLKVWMQENPDLRKSCPTCKAAIEKDEGCNHMECFNCKSHLCWLCLKVFPTGDEVYDHLPYCPKNQGR